MYNKYLELGKVNSKIYLIIMLLSWTLFFYNIWVIKPVIVRLNDFLGLTSHLTWAYWVGYILIIASSIVLYTDKNNNNELLYIGFLITIGLFLFSVPIFAEDNARFQWSYYPAGEVKTVLNKHKIDSISDWPLTSYRSWPATHIISAYIIYMTNISVDHLIKYMPIFWLILTIFGTYSIGKKLELSNNQSFLASFLVLSSFWTFNYYYGPQSMAYLLYILFFMIYISHIKDVKNVKNTILMILTFSSVVITHMLTSILLIIPYIFSSVLIIWHEKRVKIFLLIVIIFAAWYVHLAPVMFKAGVREFVRQATMTDVLSFINTDKYGAGNLLTRKITHYTRLFYMAVYAILMIIVVTFYMKGKINHENKKLIKICLYWLIGILSLLMLQYGAEIDDRVYIFSLIPMAYILTLSFNKKFMVMIAMLLIIPHIPAHYGTESIDMIYSSELKGQKFFAETAYKDSNRYLYYPSAVINYFDNSMILYRAISYKSYCNVNDDFKENIKVVRYILLGIQLDNFLRYSCTTDISYIKNNMDNGYSYIYNNGQFDIYYMNINNE